MKVENEVEDGSNPPVIEDKPEEFEPETKPVTPDPTPEVVDTVSVGVLANVGHLDLFLFLNSLQCPS